MKRCKICGQMCDDSVKLCPVCKNSEFTEVQQPEGMYGNPGSWADTGQNMNGGSQNINGGAWKGGGQNINGGSWNDGGRNMNGGMPTGFQTGGEPMNKKMFYKRCIPPAFKSQMAAGYMILAVNIILFAVMGILYDETVRFIDVGIMSVILLGLVLTKHVVFAVADTMYFIVAYIIAIVMQQRSAGFIPLVIAGILIPTTSRIGKLWRRYKRTGEYIDYSRFAGTRRRWPVYVLLVIVLIVLAGGGMLLMDSGTGSYEQGKWTGSLYENEYMELELQLPDKSDWKITDEEDLDELNAEAREEAGIMSSEQFDFVVTNTSENASIMLLHLKTSLSGEEAYEQIKEGLAESYRQQYGQKPEVVDDVDRLLADSRYYYLRIKSTVMGMPLYQSVYVRKIGREVCEISMSAADEDALDEMEGFFKDMR